MDNLTLCDNMTRQLAIDKGDIPGPRFLSCVLISLRRGYTSSVKNVHEKIKKDEKADEQLRWTSQVRKRQVSEQAQSWEEEVYQILLCRHHICNLFCWILYHLRPGNWEHQGRW